MKTLAVTLCIVGTAFALSACETSSSYDSGSSYATSRTAGEVDSVDNVKPMKAERVFREVQTK